MVLKYAKGAGFERQLKKALESKGFFVVRAAGSGVDSTSPDLIVLSSTKKFGLECKAWENNLWLEKEKIQKMIEWEKRTAIPVYIAWKKNREEWKFLPLSMLRETNAAFVADDADLDVAMKIHEL